MTEPAFSDVERAILVDVLDRLLPGNEGLAPAGEMGLAPALLDDATTSPPLAAALESVIRQLPQAFGELNAQEQDEALRGVEATDPPAFAGLINLAYSAYYTDARVLASIATQAGYEPRPPQPRGYELAPFDDRLLEQVSRRAPLWRKAV